MSTKLMITQKVSYYLFKYRSNSVRHLKEFRASGMFYLVKKPFSSIDHVAQSRGNRTESLDE
jgi:hypothetical protein